MGVISINVGYQMFDISIHSGIKTAIKLLQKAVGVKQDGVPWAYNNRENKRFLQC